MKVTFDVDKAIEETLITLVNYEVDRTRRTMRVYVEFEYKGEKWVRDYELIPPANGKVRVGDFEQNIRLSLEKDFVEKPLLDIMALKGDTFTLAKN